MYFTGNHRSTWCYFPACWCLRASQFLVCFYWALSLWYMNYNSESTNQRSCKNHLISNPEGFNFLFLCWQNLFYVYSFMETSTSWVPILPASGGCWGHRRDRPRAPQSCVPWAAASPVAAQSWDGVGAGGGKEAYEPPILPGAATPNSSKSFPIPLLNLMKHLQLLKEKKFSLEHYRHFKGKKNLRT